MPDLPSRASLEYLRKQAKKRNRQTRRGLSRAQYEIAREYGFASWPELVRHVHATRLQGMHRALVLAATTALTERLHADHAAATAPVDGVVPLLLLLRRSIGNPADIRECTRQLLDAGADPDSHTIEWNGEGRQSALFDAVERRDLELARLLVERGATPDEDAFYHACEQSDTAFLDLLYQPGFESLVGHKLDFEDVPGLRWFLDKGASVDTNDMLHHAIVRGRSTAIIAMLLDAGADPNKPWEHWDVGRRPLALAARSGHLAAYELLIAHSATADLDPVDAAVLAIARGESAQPPKARPPALGMASDSDYRWILGQFALLGQTHVVRALLDAGMPVDSRGWSNFTPLDQAAMNGRTETVRLLIDRGADLHDGAFGPDGPTPLDCAIWGLRNNHADDGDYPGTIEALLTAQAPTSITGSTGDPGIDALLARHREEHADAVQPTEE
jgi:ankyrin repeat protein